jgi:hypothetical protein
MRITWCEERGYLRGTLPMLHKYAAVHAKSNTKLEFLPLEFFRKLPDALPEHMEVTFVEDMTAGGRVSGLRWRCGRMEPTTTCIPAWITR